MCYTGKDKSRTAAQYEHCDEILKEKTAHLGIHVTREDIIHSFDNAKGTNGSIAMPGISELSPLCPLHRRSTSALTYDSALVVKALSEEKNHRRTLVAWILVALHVLKNSIFITQKPKAARFT